MTGILLRHKILIVFFSLIIISLFLLIAFMMHDSNKIPSKGVFVLKDGQHLQVTYHSSI